MEEKKKKKKEKWQGLRESGFRVLFVGFFSLVIAFMIYSRFTMPSSELLRVESHELIGLAYGMLAITVDFHGIDGIRRIHYFSVRADPDYYYARLY